MKIMEIKLEEIALEEKKAKLQLIVLFLLFLNHTFLYYSNVTPGFGIDDFSDSIYNENGTL